MRKLATWLGLASAALWLLIVLLLTAISPSITYSYLDSTEDINSEYTVSCDAILTSRGETISPSSSGSYNWHFKVTDGEDIYDLAANAFVDLAVESTAPGHARFEHEIEIDCAHARTTRLAWVGIIAIPAVALAMAANRRRTKEPHTLPQNTEAAPRRNGTL